MALSGIELRFPGHLACSPFTVPTELCRLHVTRNNEENIIFLFLYSSLFFSLFFCPIFFTFVLFSFISLSSSLRIFSIFRPLLSISCVNHSSSPRPFLFLSFSFLFPVSFQSRNFLSFLCHSYFYNVIIFLPPFYLLSLCCSISSVFPSPSPSRFSVFSTLYHPLTASVVK